MVPTAGIPGTGQRTGNLAIRLPTSPHLLSSQGSGVAMATKDPTGARPATAKTRPNRPVIGSLLAQEGRPLWNRWTQGVAKGFAVMGTFIWERMTTFQLTA